MIKHILHKAEIAFAWKYAGKAGDGLKHLMEHEGSIRRVAASAMLLLVLLIAAGGMGIERFFLPLFTYVQQEETGPAAVISNSLKNMLPLCYYSTENRESADEDKDLLKAEEEITLHIVEDGSGEGSRSDAEWEEEEKLSASGEMPEEAQIAEALTIEELLAWENEAYRFTPAVKTAEYDWASLTDYEKLLSTFYTIDSYALAGSDLLNLDSLMERDVTIEKTTPGPQILIYHTHSKEAFIDSAPGEQADTIVGVGEVLTQLLTEEYGYEVLHHTVEYDTVRDDAYAKSLPAIEKLLAENPSIQVVIDLHRDAGSAARDMVVDIDGRRTARFMFFNGISRSKKTGDIDYLKNPNLSDNLAFSFQMQAAAGQYYPGLTRKIYIKQYRYNMHLRGRTLLVELGDENNTVEEAKNACYPLAHLLDMVLSGTVQ